MPRPWRPPLEAVPGYSHEDPPSFARGWTEDIAPLRKRQSALSAHCTRPCSGPPPIRVFICNARSHDQEGRIGKKQNVLQSQGCPAKTPGALCRVSALALGINHHCGTVRLISTRFTLRPACLGVLVPMLLSLFFLAMMQGTTPPSLTAREILETYMVQADNDGLPLLPDI